MPEAAPTPATTRLTLEPIDTVHAYQAHYWERLKSRQSILVICLGVPVIMAFGPLLLPGNWPGIVAIWIVALLAGFVTPFVRTRWFLPRTARRIHAQQKALHEPLDVAFCGWPAADIIERHIVHAMGRPPPAP